ncbi:MAG: GIY-YIG nuclease family protein [Bacteroidetes bacterium]|nr:GIY-YIG nuclease family protein [Bacteroidota bacterium]
MKRGWVYILLCADNSYYTGSTSSLETRIAQHYNGSFGGYTAQRLPVKLLWTQEFASIEDAVRAERQIKGWCRRKKEALMRGDFELLRALSRNHSGVDTRKSGHPSTRSG